MSKTKQSTSPRQPGNTHQEGSERRALSRRSILGVSAGAAAAAALPNAAAAVRPAGRLNQSDESGWQPKFLSANQGQTLATLCDVILPKTNTPSATEAGVHEYIDEALSVASGDEQLEFLGGLSWIEARARSEFSQPFLELSNEEHVELLESISDDKVASAETQAGATFFTDLKRRTLFGYYTSKVGRTEALGLPDKITRVKLEGCQHGPGGHG